MTRIRYKKISKNVYESTRKIHLGPYLVVIYINVLSNILTIKDGSILLYKSQEKNYKNAQKKAKKVLKELGAKFPTKPKRII